ncbi:sulfite exporter TauE/SafE family protein [Anaerosalibacter massiliensis]|uniref:Probable membrane transporter protein n=1 Tax=Anaerosalibacter massiliensis TaxID=1347392 RepID=A0A9X2MG78_9FIRM|nr:sulfite exporter TauE/SafE family protein [Anaerosalibacter massiliensis]MCR2042953.1 sulfite exporter TauE/SafE family protein [Anaerosalibacter massiliensis]
MKLFIIGFFSGIVSGMGIGGGTILIPSLILFTELTQKQAQGINLIVFIPISIVALIIHYLNKNIEFKLAILIIVGGVIGALIGSSLAIKINSNVLKKLFSILLLCIGIGELFIKKE